MAVTRIKNNQIYDKTITYAKIADGTIVGSLFNPDVTINSNITITGNFSVTGNSDTISATNTYINDPLVTFNNGFTGTPSYDIGVLINRNLYSTAPYGSVNAAWVWREEEKGFTGIMTNETGSTTGSINNSGFANLSIGNVYANTTTIRDNIDSTSPWTGALLSKGGVGVQGNVHITREFRSGGNIGNQNGALLTSNTVGYLFNETVTTLNVGAAATTINAGNNSGTTNLLGILKVSGNIVAQNTANSTDFDTGSIVVRGGMAVDKNMTVASAQVLAIGNVTPGTGAFTTLTSNGLTTVTNTTESLSHSNGALVVDGGVGINKNLNVHGNVIIDGNLTVHGVQTIINTQDVAIQDAIINLHTFANLAPLTTDDGRDIGIAFHYYKTENSTAFLGWSNDTGALEWYADGTEEANVFTGGNYGTIKTGEIWIANTTPSISDSANVSGALRVDGGVGVAGNLNVGYVGGTSTFFSNVVVGPFADHGKSDNLLTISKNEFHQVDNLALVHLVGEDGQRAQVTVDTHGSAISTIPALVGRRSRGTADSPSAVEAGDLLALFGGRGYGSTGYSDTSRGFVGVSASETWTDSAQGTNIVFFVTPLGSTTENLAVRIAPNGNVIVTATTDSVSPTTGSFVTHGGIGILGNVFTNRAATFNNSMDPGMDFYIKGDNEETLFWTRPSATYDQILMGGNATVSTLVPGAKLQINSTDSVILPRGTNSERPGSSGFTDVEGMFRYNTASKLLEWFDGTQWATPGTQLTVITDEQFSGNGIDNEFTLDAVATTASTIVSINGVLQIPTLAYSVVETTLTFTEIPHSGDIIDVRRLTTTTEVLGIASTNGYMQLQINDQAVQIWTGSVGTSVTTYWDQTGGKVTSIGNVSVASANTPTTIDSFDKNTYRSAKYVVQVTHGTDFQTSESLVVHNDTTSTMSEYSIVRTSGNLGVLQTTVSGSNVLVQFVAANASNTVRITKDYTLH